VHAAFIDDSKDVKWPLAQQTASCEHALPESAGGAASLAPPAGVHFPCSFVHWASRIDAPLAEYAYSFCV
jgi:hypothetical protein